MPFHRKLDYRVTMNNDRREQRLRDDVVFVDTSAETSFAPSLMAVGFGILTAVSLFRGAIRSTIMGSAFSATYYFAAKCMTDPFYERHKLGHQVAIGASSSVILVMGTRALYRMSKKAIAVVPWTLTTLASVSTIHHVMALRELKALHRELIVEPTLTTVDTPAATPTTSL